jgi:hypothetical protein
MERTSGVQINQFGRQFSDFSGSEFFPRMLRVILDARNTILDFYPSWWAAGWVGGSGAVRTHFYTVGYDC